MKLRKGILFTTSLILSSISIAQLAHAKREYVPLQPYNGAIYCFQCHNAATESQAGENNATLPYGLSYGAYRSYTAIEPLDGDSDGFSNIQEIRGFSNFNLASSKPVLALATNNKTTGTVTVKPLVNETVALAQSQVAPIGLQLLTGQKNIGGVVDMTFTNLTLGKATPTLMFSTGGIQPGGKAYFVNPTNTAGTAFPATINPNGSITLSAIADEGPYDLYTQVAYINTAKARTPAIDATATISPYATVSPLAVINPYATINDYATIGAYALIGANAIVDTYATIDDYTEVIASATVPANGTISIPTSFTGIIQTKVAVVTTTPSTINAGGRGGDDNDGEGSDSAGGLHCMTSGLGLQGLMFLSLFGAGYLLRRKKK